MKKLTKKLTYDATTEAVAAMLADPAFREEVLERQHVVRGSATVDGDVVTVEQVRSADGVPSFARSFVGDEIAIVQQDTWTSATTADIELSIPGKPGHAQGTLALTDAGGRTTETIDLEVSIKIPLVGGKVETMITDLLARALDVEHRVGVEWLGR
ncbi:DUF2505 domain-containing protein [Nocardioides hwasunensis]|uniref:DUF2505 domain-containing protein n=1 Tax=Nocardioides hwasunensis TaxID=397258 RepID=A0ABR8MFY1_9ACTN|nr:DUF2505 domain-containing protein [Nocardioides hwasunensis]MBD3914981.1 DUF2505 domain-containing protein [Nocardioides hwasunensis]